MHPALLSPDDPRAPKYWMHETSGVLRPVMRRYLSGERLDRDQIGLMRRYLEQWFDSPIWDQNPAATDEAKALLKLLRQRVHAISTNQDIRAVLKDALDLGIDPI